jgi:hypothetical protein
MDALPYHHEALGGRVIQYWEPSASADAGLTVPAGGLPGQKLGLRSDARSQSHGARLRQPSGRIRMGYLKIGG